MDEIVLPKFMRIGKSSVKSITDILEKINCNRPIIITDKNMIKFKVIAPLEEALMSKQIRYTIYDNTIPEPTSESIQEGVSLIKKGNYDSIIAFGGGSPIDSAKAISILSKFSL